MFRLSSELNFDEAVARELTFRRLSLALSLVKLSSLADANFL